MSFQFYTIELDNPMWKILSRQKQLHCVRGEMVGGGLGVVLHEWNSQDSNVIVANNHI